MHTMVSKLRRKLDEDAYQVLNLDLLIHQRSRQLG